VTTSTRFRDHPIGHLSLQHHHQTTEKIVARQQPAEDRGPDRVGQIGGNLPRRFSGQSDFKVHAQCIRVPDLKTTATKSLRKRRHKALVEFEGYNTVESVEQRPGQRATARPDFEHPRRLGLELFGDSLGN
jgi:hypothetical protein